MDPNEYYDFEDRRYINPTLSRDEQMGFVNTLRDTVGRNTAQINTQTQALGSNLPSTQGGLTGSNNYFAQRYQTTPLESQVNTLKATAQAKALNDLMTNYQNQAANRYQQAYRSAAARSKSGGDDAKGDLLEEDLSPDGFGDLEDPENWQAKDSSYILGSDGKYYKKSDLKGKYTRVRTTEKKVQGDSYTGYTPYKPVMKDKYITADGTAVYFPAGQIDK